MKPKQTFNQHSPVTMKKHFVIYSLSTLLVLCVLPFFFPREMVTQSSSYRVGFNNTVGMGLLIITALLLLIIAFYHRRTHSKRTLEGFWSIEKLEYGSTKILKWCISIQTLVLVFIEFALDHGTFYGYMESEYFLHYAYAIQGGVSIYNDIQFIYGPLFVYPVCWISKIGISITFSYFIYLSLLHAIGVVALYYILGATKFSIHDKNVILVLFCILAFPLAYGLNGTSIRFSVSPALFLLFLRTNDKKFIQSLVLIVSSLMIFLLSPEIGLIYVTVVSSFALIRFVRHHEIWQLINVGSVFVCIVFVFLAWPDYFSSILQAATGGSNSPFKASVLFYLLITSILITAWYYGESFAQKNCWDEGEIALSLIIFGILPLSLGRFDAQHIFYPCFMILVMGYYFMIQWFKKKFVLGLYFFASFFFFLGTLTTSGVNLGKSVIKNNVEYLFPIIEMYANSNLPASANVKAKLDKFVKKQSESIDYGKLFTGLTTTTSISVDNSVYVYLLNNTLYKDSYFGHTPQWVGTKDGFIKEIESLKDINAEYIILPIDYKERWLTEEGAYGFKLNLATFFPVHEKRHYADQLYGDLICYIDANYTVFREDGKIKILKRN